MKAFTNEPILELRRGAVRAQLGGALAAHDARGPLRVPVWIGDEQRDGRRDRVHRPGRPRPGRGRGGGGAEADDDAWRPRSRRRGRGTRAGGAARGDADPGGAVAARAAAGDRRARGPRVREAVARGRRRRVRGDRLPRVLRARGDRPRRRARRCCSCPASATSCATPPRGVVAVISPWNFPVAIPLGMTAAALATGNAAILKPAEQAPGCALHPRAGAARGRRAAGGARAAARRGRRRRARWCATRACTRSRSRARARSGWRSSSAAAESRPGRSTSSA